MRVGRTAELLQNRRALRRARPARKGEVLDAVVIESPRDQPHRVGEHDEHDDLVRAGPPGVGVRRALRFGFLIGNELVLALDLFEGPAVRAGEVVVNESGQDESRSEEEDSEMTSFPDDSYLHGNFR